MRSCTLRFAAISLVLLAHGAQAAEGEVAPAPTAAETPATPTPVDPLAPTPVDPLAAAPEPMMPPTDPAPQADPAMDPAAATDTTAIPAEAAPSDAMAAGDPPTPAAAEDGAETGSPAADGMAWDQPGSVADEAMPAEEAPPAAPAPQAESRHVVLGPMAVDPEGREGRIHTVVSGDTLWDISEAYLGTPWVWPSVWTDNDDIQNPHVINPGDHVWITSGEMRIVSKDEADSMIAAQRDLAQVNGDDDWEAMDTGELEPAELIEGPEDDMLADEASPAALDPLSVTVPLDTPADGDLGITVQVTELEAMGFVSADDIEAATSIVASPSPRSWLVNDDIVDLGLGEGEVEVGDEFTIFRDFVPVYDIRDGRIQGGELLGYHVHILGWAVVREVKGETSLAEIRMSQSEMKRGDRVIPRPKIDVTVDVMASPDGIEGHIVYMPDSRTRMGDGDYVYINRGAVHGFELGSEVEVYVPGSMRTEKVTGNRLMTPDRIVSRMVLVDVKPESSVAYVVSANSELERGDLVRPSTREVASR